MSSGNFYFIINFLVIFLSYFLTVRLGSTTLLWLPSGISLALLLIMGFRFWPAITLGAFAANSLAGISLPQAAIISITNTLEGLTGFYLLKRIVNFRNSLDKLKDVLWLIFLAGIVSTAIGAILGTSGLLFTRMIELSEYFPFFLTWWTGDIASSLIVTPFILVWSRNIRLNAAVIKKRFLEFAGLTASIALTVIIIFGNFFYLEHNLHPRGYMSFPILIWAALRFGSRGAITATFVLSIVSILLTYLGIGPFADKVLGQNLVSVKVYVSVLSISAMILAAVASERKELEERRDEFISIASHELKTPLTTIKGYTQILNQFLQKIHDKKILLYLGKMEEQLNRLTKLVNDLLNVSKIQTNKLVLQKEEFKIDDLIKSIIEEMQLTSKHQIIFESGSRGKRVWVDKYRISEVLINLLTNAIKFSPRSDKIYVRTSFDANIVVSVQDFGIGITKKDKDRIFQRFFQADTKIRRSFQGLGLGLYISSEIIRQHGGTIWMDSVKGKGSTVFFSLPLGRGKINE